VGTGKGRHIVIDLRITLWTLQGRIVFPHDIPSTRLKSVSCDAPRAGSGSLGKRTFSHDRKDARLLLDIKTTINFTYGGGRKFHVQESIWQSHARERTEAQHNAGGNFQ
jgi:hypothetical protein